MDPVNIVFVNKPGNPACSFCKTSKEGRIVICNPQDDCFICSDCIKENDKLLAEIRQSLTDTSRRN